MFRIVYHGSHKKGFTALKNSFPQGTILFWQRSRSGLSTLLEAWKPHVLIYPLNAPGPDDFDYLNLLLEKPEAPPIILTVKKITLSQAVGFMRLGAADCLCEPVYPPILSAAVKKLLPPVSESTNGPLSRIIGTGPAITSIKNEICQLASSDHPVLILGETGTGKELAAQAIHQMSSRRKAPFIPINCGAFPQELLSSELFGSRVGAFTGAVDRPGRFEAASGGTIFLDEIGELPLHSQTFLLRVLEEKFITRLGGTTRKKIDVRIISATSRNLKDMMTENHFRKDLFYRLGVLSLTMPPLRSRKDDIPLLAHHFLAESGNNHPPPKLNGEALAKLIHYPWPGNIREFRSVILRAAIHPEPVIRAKNLVFI